AWYEGFGLPPLEAMACGTPCVGSDRPGLPGVGGAAALVVPADQPAVAGHAALIAPADQPDAWRKALEGLLDDTQLAADLRHGGILRAAEFSWPRAARQTWRALDDAVKQQPRG